MVVPKKKKEKKILSFLVDVDNGVYVWNSTPDPIISVWYEGMLPETFKY
jgi:hypothetical protein